MRSLDELKKNRSELRKGGNSEESINYPSIAQEIMERFTIKTTRDNQNVLIYMPDFGYYVSGITYINEVGYGEYGITTKNQMVNVIENIRARSFVERELFEKHDGFVNLKNGVLELSTMTLHDHNPEYYFLNRVEVDYIPDATCPRWESVIQFALSNEQDRLTLQEWFGYQLFSGQPLESAMFMIGKPSTSKSTILGILKILLGVNSTVSFALQDFDKESTKAVPSLYGKIANICFDMGMETVKDTGKFKQLTGSNDTLSARMLYVMPFQFNNSAKLTFAANNTPLLSPIVEKDEAFWKRIILLHFINQITTEQKDVELSNKLKAHELPGILNWMLVGYRRLLANKRFTNQDSNTIYSRWEATKAAETESDRFFDECCFYNPEGFVVKEVLRMNYMKWCSTESIRLGKSIIPLSPYKYAECLSRIYPEVVGRQERINGDREYVWKGISINTNPVIRVADDSDQLTLRSNFMARVAKIDADEAAELEHLIKQHEEEFE